MTAELFGLLARIRLSRRPMDLDRAAGDQYLFPLVGVVVGLVAGLPLGDAHQLGSLVAALSVTSPHTINKDIDRAALRRFAIDAKAPLSEPVRRLLEDPD